MTTPSQDSTNMQPKTALGRHAGGYGALGRWLQLGAAAGLCLSLMTVTWFANARAHFEHELRAVGQALLNIEAMEAVTAKPQAASINGQRLLFASQLTTLSLADVLEAVQKLCRGENGRTQPHGGASQRGSFALPEALANVANSLHASHHSPTQGVATAACFVNDTNTSFAERLLRFAHTGDLTAFGAVRYFMVQRDGAAHQTHVLSVWSDGELNVRRLFPEHGDAPGGDSVHIPRPALSRRLLTAELPDGAHAYRVYESHAPPDAILSDYTKNLGRRGFDVHRLSDAALEHDLSETSVAFTKAGSAVIVACRQRSAATDVQIVELAARGVAEVKENGR